jgi:hypothetical protein
MDLTDCTVSGNTSKYSGGGLVNYPSSSVLTLTRCTVTGNSSGASGGLSNSGTATVTDSTFTANHADDEGGAIRNDGILTVVGSTLSGNTATGHGGGVWARGRVQVANSTLAGNSADYGGGVLVYGGSTRLTNVTITGNRSQNDDGGGLDVVNANTPDVLLLDCLVAGNFLGASGTAPGDVSGALGSKSAGSLVGDGDNLSGLTNGTQGNQLGTASEPIDARLSPLADHGGPTQTVSLLKGSPAIDAGVNAFAVDPTTHTASTTDQRGTGFARVVNGVVDIGAFEVQPAVTTLSATDATGVFGGTITLVANLTSGGLPLAGASVAFTLNMGGRPTTVGSAGTDANGVAKLVNISVKGISAGRYQGAVAVDYAGDGTHLPSGASAELTVTPAPATLRFGPLSFVFSGTPHAATVTTQPAGLSGVTITYTQNGKVVPAPTGTGTYSVQASLVTANFVAPPITATLVINKATPLLIWVTPADIVSGTPLGGTQLDAFAPIAGTFAYMPIPGTLLHAGQNQRLSVVFTPTDSLDFTSATKSVRINVRPAPTPPTPHHPPPADRTPPPSPPLAPPSSPTGGPTITDAPSAIITILFDDILGRDPDVAELAQGRVALGVGESPRALALSLWHSPEHRELRARGMAPRIQLSTALRDALRAARLVQLANWLHPGGPQSLVRSALSGRRHG